MKPVDGEKTMQRNPQCSSPHVLICFLYCLLSGCATVIALQERPRLENEHRQAINDVIEAEALFIANCNSLKPPRTCIYPPSWPVVILVSFKKGEASLISLPSLPEVLMP